MFKTRLIDGIGVLCICCRVLSVLFIANLGTIGNVGNESCSMFLVSSLTMKSVLCTF